MSGICAVLGRNAEQTAKEICGSLRHRGPDGEGLFVDGNLALGHTALNIGNAPVPHQPLSNEDQTVWVTFDGEIYNRKQLREELERSHTFNNDSAAELAVHAYEEYGYRCMDKFNGMFAFCLWDSEQKRLFSARDRVGMKPIYHYSSQNRLILASEIKGILADSSVPRKPNDRFIYQFLVTGLPRQTGDTFFLGVKSLMAAHYMVVDKNGMEVRRYWHPTQHLRADIRANDESWCASQLLKLLRDSINARLPADLPVGTFLSGGLDSTSIAFLVQENLNARTPVHSDRAEGQETFSAIYEEPLERPLDEKPYIEEAERALRIHVNHVFPSVAGQWEDIKKFVLYIEEPVAVFNYYVFWCLFRAAGQRVKVVFSGQGGDASLGGQTEHAMTYFKELWKKREIGKLMNEVTRSLDWILLKLNPSTLLGVVLSTLFRGNTESKAKLLLANKFVAAHDDDLAETEDDTLQKTLVTDVTHHSVEYLRVDDRGSSAFSMECRHPFLDHRLVEFAFSLPADQKVRNGWTKYVLRNAMKGLIPEAVRQKRRKAGTPIPQQSWMRELRPQIRQVLESAELRERGYFNQPAILDIFDRYCEGRLNRLACRYYADAVWRVLNLELWLEAFFDSTYKTRRAQS